MRCGAGWILGAIILKIATAGVAHAEYPDRPIHLLVPYPPGGLVDTMARTMQEPLSKALCRADGVDIEAELVRNGMALAFVRYSRDYVLLEDQARADGLGMHGHQCEKPWDWRARQRADK